MLGAEGYKSVHCSDNKIMVDGCPCPGLLECETGEFVQLAQFYHATIV